MRTKLFTSILFLISIQCAFAAVSVGADGRANSGPRRSGAIEDGGKILTPDVIGAVSNVMGVAQLVSTSREFCAATRPSAHKRYTLAAQGWDQRNSAVVAQKDRILSHPVQQMVAEALSADMHRKTANLMHPVKQSTPSERAQWCDKAFEDVDRGVLDLVGRASIAPLMNYGRR